MSFSESTHSPACFWLALVILIAISGACNKPNPGQPSPIAREPVAASQIYFNDHDTIGDWGVYRSDADGENREAVMIGRWFITSQPRSGRFTAVKEPSLDHFWDPDSLFVVDIADRTTRLLGTFGRHWVTSAVLSPDGSKVLAHAGPDAPLTIIDVETGNSLLLSSTADWMTPPAFSPDGELVAYTSVDGLRASLRVVGIDGSGDREVADSADPYACAPTWSPDGKMIAYMQIRGYLRSELWIVRSDGTDKRLLDTTSHHRFDPDWSPDGSRLVYSCGIPIGSRELWVINADGSGRRNVTNTSEQNEDNPSWSPDGKRILFNSYNEVTGGSLKTIELSSGEISAISDQTGARGYWERSAIH